MSLDLDVSSYVYTCATKVSASSPSSKRHARLVAAVRTVIPTRSSANSEPQWSRRTTLPAKRAARRSNQTHTRCRDRGGISFRRQSFHPLGPHVAPVRPLQELVMAVSSFF